MMTTGPAEPALPTGTVTFLFTDIEGSTALWERAPDAMREALLRHDEILRDAVVSHAGFVFATGGDGFAVAFSTAGSAVEGAVEAQRTLRSEPWSAGVELKVRMGLHSGESNERDDDYFGPNVNRAARLMASAHGGQIVVSSATRALLDQSGLPEGVDAEDVGTHRLKGLERPEDVTHLVVDDVCEFGALRSMSTDRTNLPVARTTFVGRRRELDTLARLADVGSLVTIVGPGGMGKTRLALAHAHSVDGFSDGVWFVDLTDSETVEAVPSKLLSTLGTVSAEGVADRFVAAAQGLSHWRALIVVDNCEHVIDAAARMADALLDHSPHITVITTSREPLAIEGERVLRLGGLRAEDGEAQRLFVDRMRLASPDYRPSAEELSIIAGLCADLDRMPLALELAAARATKLGLNDVVEGLLASGGDRRQRGRPRRHGSMRDVVHWSLDLLPEVERMVFRSLAVFDGGFTLDAARDVVAIDAIEAGQVADIVGALVDQSLVDVVRQPHGNRYRMLSTIRAQATAELEAAGEVATVRDRHFQWVAQWSEKTALDRFDSIYWWTSPIELDNQRAALGHAIETGRIEEAVELLAHSMISFCVGGANVEAAVQLEALRQARPEPDEQTAVLFEFCDLLLLEVNGDFINAHMTAEDLRERASDERLWYLISLVMAHHLDALDPNGAIALYDEIDSRFGPTPMTTYGRGEAAITQRRYDDAINQILSGFGIGDVSSLPLSTPESPLDTTILSDLTVALDLAGRSDEAHIVIDALAEAMSESQHSYACAVQLLRAVVGSAHTPLGETLALLNDAARLERQWPEPVMAYDCVAAGAMTALRIGQPEIAARAFASIHGGPSRSVGTYAWRTAANHQIRRDLDDDTRRALTELGKDATPRDAFARLRDSLAAEMTQEHHRERTPSM